MAKFSIEDIKIFAKHGHFKEENQIGIWFLVSVYYETDSKDAERSDFLVDTLDYTKIVEIVDKEMKIQSLLVENVAYRIKKNILQKYPSLVNLRVKVSKLHPSIGEVGKFSVEL
jgi:dihydroneopterin aldolase